ncbi:PREDICTED: short-chain dehydrogenase reductase 3b-like [Ipomoea nil]|uniref:short-chain dehydrogenase reductase 3b-like n=1 Tax=Ipomoea nil TaxID=35883 RepID=UPI0009016725|nr:PREDICTED: short-chain dehydrogenase reductase 3b-like [Ipomoea nil]
MSSTTTTTSRRLEGKVALITGAASGIGEAAVRVFAEEGALVVAADVQDELGHRLVQSINNNNNSAQAEVCYHHCDVRDEKQVEETVSYAVSRYGRLDILLSNAAIMGPMAGIMELDLQGLDDTMATNVRGVAATIKHAARAMVAGRTRGSMICTSSVAGCLGGSGPHAYTTSKHAIVGLVRSVCSELGAHGIRVNSIAPFGVATPLSCKAYGLDPSQVEANTSAIANLKGIVLKPAHVAKVALFLASDDSAYISGQNLAVDGGYTVVTHSPAHFIPSD